MTNETLGAAIEQARKNKNLSRRALAQVLECDQQSIYRWERSGATPSVDTLRRIARALGTRFTIG